MCLSQGHKAVTPVRLEPGAPRSRVQRATTEELHSNPSGSALFANFKDKNNLQDINTPFYGTFDQKPLNIKRAIPHLIYPHV